MSGEPLLLDLADENATSELGEDIAAALARGDAVALAGDLGSGKTTLARALLRAFHDDAALEVPSPTFTLVQSYDAGRFPIAHLDLYRLRSAAELDEIGLEEALSDGAVLIEWPELAVTRLPESTLSVTLAIAGSGRRARIQGSGGIAERFTRSRCIRAFLNGAGWQGASRRHLQGDASTRAFERVSLGVTHGVVMDAPKRPDGPPIKDGKPYSQIAHLAETVRPFVAVGDALAAAGLSAPVIHASDLDAGLVLMEDLGRLPVVENSAPIADRYRVAVELLAALHGQDLPGELRLPDGSTYRLPVFDRGALAIEVSLAVDWYGPYALGDHADGRLRQDFAVAWDLLFDRLAEVELSWMLRDFHSPNLIWCPEREGIRRIGLVDFQDALLGPAAYDLASLLQDARVTVPAALEDALYAHYARLRQADPGFDEAEFRAAYLIMAAQRASKVLGIFVRLAKRDGKPAYLAHLPRIRGYLERLLSEPALAGLRPVYRRLLDATPAA